MFTFDPLQKILLPPDLRDYLNLQAVKAEPQAVR
jgi:hypothetical protein